MAAPSQVRLHEEALLVALPPEPASRARAPAHVGGRPGTCLDKTFRDLPTLLPPNSHLVLNDSRVIAARVHVRRSDGTGPNGVELLLLHPEQPTADPTAAAAAPAHNQVWRCMLRESAAALRPGDEFASDAAPSTLCFTVTDVHAPWVEVGEPDGAVVSVRLSTAGDADTLVATLAKYGGTTPVPPYLRRAATPDDASTYQTVFASNDGSVAAPTAGLHMTERVLDALLLNRCSVDKLTLHVGAGTFQPLDGNVAEHSMHEEAIVAEADALRRIADSVDRMRPIVPVGTTSARSLETLYWLGVKARRNGAASLGPLPWHLSQWEAYHLGSEGTSPQVALRALADAADERNGGSVRASTALIIVPGYAFQLVDALVTNFHAPDSTLMLLVGALVGGVDRIRAVYAHALESGYRFLSYGDASLLYNERKRALWEQEDRITYLGDVPAERRRDLKVLLHSCCAPCSGAMIEELVGTGVDVTVFWYNPNIHPRKEYEIRKEENRRYAERLGIAFVDADYDVDEWYRRAAAIPGGELSPERGERCTMCFDMRYERTVAYAAAHGFTHVTSTNATSRWKDAAQVSASGVRSAMASEAAVRLLEHDWQTEAMSERKYRINAAESFYKQEYCGCSFSLRDVNAYRERQGQPPVRIGDAGVYADPVADAREESADAVDAFFRDDRSGRMAEWRRERLERVYRDRRKGDASSDNW